MSETQYRPEINGLRALSIISVFLYHIQENLLPGGFIGVDVFFVLSGYLITKSIFSQTQAGRFSLGDFYSRRITRLLPSLYIVLFIALIAAYLVMTPADIFNFNASIVKVMAFWSNHHFAQGRDYFSMLSNEVPLLHTWSLAVEEQFYFIWPLTLIGAVYLKLSKKQLITLSVTLAILSLIYGSYANLKINPTYAYYSFPTRFGELLVGSILAILNLQQLKPKPWHSLLGLLMVLFSFVFINKNYVFPGLITLIPCLGTVLVLISEENVFIKWLRWAPLEFIGKISYQLYLWHWPLLAISRYVTGKYSLSLLNNLLIVLGSFLLSTAVWKYIETPIRYKRIKFIKALSYYYIIPSAIILILIKISPLTFFQSKYFSADEFNSHGTTEICHSSLDDLSVCTKGAKKQKPDVLVFGDSHTAHLNYFFDELGKKQNISFLIVSGSSCSPVLGFDENTLDSEATKKHCKVLKEFIVKNADGFNTVILSSRWDFHLGYANYSESKRDLKYREKLIATLDFLKNKKVYLVTEIPLLERSPQRTELMNHRFLSGDSIHHFNYDNGHNEDIKKLKDLYPNIEVLDLNLIVKNLLNQKDSDKNVPFYMDKDHLNTYGEKQLAKAVEGLKEFQIKIN